MKLLDLSINGFGKFHGRQIAFEDGINIIYGKNEAGKSTIHTFIRGMLFGIERQRGRAARNDLYTKYEPWEDSGTYEGKLRLEHEGRIYRIERVFKKKQKRFAVVDETKGLELSDPSAFMEELLGGLSETAYNNTVSIGQLKSATEEGMVTELKNYIANMNTTGDMSLNITKATAYLKKQRRELEGRMVPEAARSYASAVSEIRNIEKEIAAPDFENQLGVYDKARRETKEMIEGKQKAREELLQSLAREKQTLAGAGFTDQGSVTSCLLRARDFYDDYIELKRALERKSRKFFTAFPLVLATAALCLGGALYYTGETQAAPFARYVDPLALFAVSAAAAVVCYVIGLVQFLKGRRNQKNMESSAAILRETLVKYLDDSSISEESMNLFQEKMAEFTRLCSTVSKSEEVLRKQEVELEELKKKLDSYGESVERQQRIQWELEKKLEQLSEYKTKAEALRHILAENDKIREELAAIDLAYETMTSLSTSIRDSFGLYLNKTASELITAITGGIYDSLSVDENLNVFMNTKSRLVPLEQISSGTMDQVYLALRLASAKLIQGENLKLPLIFDDSFVLYDDDRMRTALKWLANSFDGQILIFSCHQREAQMLTANQVPYHMIAI